MVQQAHAKVFLSSTTVGLKKIRSIAFEAIKAAGCDPIGMEDFGAVADIPGSVCQDKIAESDLYVGLFGWRYGSRPPGSDESYTEGEYRYAQLRGLPCLIFLLDDSLCREELAASPESTKFRDKQESLCRAVRVATTKSVSDPEQLRMEVVRSLGNALREEARGARAVFRRRPFLRHLKRELAVDKLNLALIGLPGIGKSKLASVFRDALPDGYRVWFQQLPEMSAAAARADITGLTTNDRAALANSALGRAASDKTVPQLADLLEALRRCAADIEHELVEVADGRADEAREMTRQLAACWWRQDLPQTVQILNQAATSAQTFRPEVLRHALFPLPFNPQRDDLDSYIEDGLQLAANAEQNMP